MTKISMKPIALAVAGLLGVSPLAFGANIKANYGEAPVPVFAQDLFNDAGDRAALVETLIIETDGGALVGYSLGMTITLSLNDGAVFDGFPGGFPMPCPTDLIGSAVPPDWTCNIATANPNGSTTLTFTLAQGDEGDALTEGTLLELDPDLFGSSLIGIKNIHGKVPGGTSTMNVRAWNPNTQTELGTDNNVVLGSFGPGVVVKSDLTALALDNPMAKIDVGADPTKTVFAADGVIGTEDTTDTFHAGDIVISVNQYGPTDEEQDVQCAGTAPPAYCGTDGFQFNVAGDKATITVTGADFGPFSPEDGEDSGIYLNQGGGCDGTATYMTVTGNTASVAVNLTGTAENTFGVCFVANGTDAISAQSLSAQVTVDFSSTDVTDPAPFANIGLRPMEYNGSVVDLYMVNPGSNPNQQAFMRWCNKSSTSGSVVLEGWDDDGVKATGTVSFMLDPNECSQFSALEMEQGATAKGLVGAMGAPTKGRWHIRGSGEFENLVAYSFIRNPGAGDVYSVTNPSTERNFAPNWVQDAARKAEALFNAGP